MYLTNKITFFFILTISTFLLIQQANATVAQTYKSFSIYKISNIYVHCLGASDSLISNKKYRDINLRNVYHAYSVTKWMEFCIYLLFV